MPGRLASRIASLILRRPRLVLALSLALTALALIPASRFRVDTDLAALLPDGAPGAEDYRVFLQHLRRLREGLRDGALAAGLWMIRSR